MKARCCLAVLVLLAFSQTGSALVFVVTNNANSGPGTLRDAITNANASAGTDIIQFNIPTVPSNSLATIALSSPLPPITDPVVIEGGTQTGSSCPPGIELDGSAVPLGLYANGLTILTDNCGIKGLVINRFPLNGIYINNAFGQNHIEGCYIGTDTNGTAGLGNGLHGIMIENSPTNYIGDTPLTDCARRNVISGNGGNGIYITGSLSVGNLVQNNRIGTDINGLFAIPNGWHGVMVDGGWGNRIGSTAAPKPVNILSGNATNGVFITITSSGNYVLGNHIGVTWSGYFALGNGQDGVLIADSGGNSIGDSSGEARNTIAGNGDDGIEIRGSAAIGNVVQGNYIGVATNGYGPLPNQGDGVELTNDCTQNLIGGTSILERNLISGNKGCGIRMDGAAFGNFVYGNYIGVNRDGLASVPNDQHGVLIVNRSQGNSIGSALGPNYGNLISGNGMTSSYHGICIAAGAYGITVAGNIIGLSANNLPLPNAGDGIRIENAWTNTIGWSGYGRNVISGNAHNGIQIGPNADHNFVYGNYIGLDTNGTTARANGNEGVYVFRSAYNIIGNTNAGFGNVISGNAGSGVLVGDNPLAKHNVIENNFIGTDATGGNKVGNSDDGVGILGGVSNRVGGYTALTGNTISGNDRHGVMIRDGAMHNLIYRNLIGVDASGLTALGNGQCGVVILDASRNSIGDPGGRGNIIGGNGQEGVYILSAGAAGNVVRANKIGVDGTLSLNLSNASHGVWIAFNASDNMVGGTSASDVNFIWFNGGAGIRIPSGTNNALYGNSIMSNGLLGIDLGGADVTPNDPQDPDVGANFLQNYPVLYEATTGSVIVAGLMNSRPSTMYRVEYFRCDAPDPSGHGEADVLLFVTNVTTDAEGNALFEHTLPVTLRTGEFVTATATDPYGNTSEFAANVPVVPNELYGDPDGDGMPTRWEGPNGLDPYDPTGDNGAEGDPDGDDVSNYEEYVADTSPGDPSNFFCFVAIAVSNETLVTYTSTNTRYYVVDYSEDLTDGSSWISLYPGSVVGSNGVTTASDSLGPTTRIYRAGVRLVP